MHRSETIGIRFPDVVAEYTVHLVKKFKTGYCPTLSPSALHQYAMDEPTASVEM